MKIELGNKILAKYYSDYLYLAIFTFIYSMILKFTKFLNVLYS